jgi:hypothetical protein
MRAALIERARSRKRERERGGGGRRRRWLLADPGTSRNIAARQVPSFERASGFFLLVRELLPGPVLTVDLTADRYDKL